MTDPGAMHDATRAHRLFVPLQPESEALLHLDALRFFAAMAIVVFHFRVHYDWPQGRLIANLDPLSLAVDLFFVISGFVISYVYAGRMRTAGEYGRFLWKRAARLVPLHWATFLIFLAIGAASWSGLFHTNHPENYPVGCVVPNILLIHALGTCANISFNYASWSISAEMALYAAFPVVAAATRRPLAGFAALAAILLLLSAASPAFGVRPWYQWTADFGALRALPEFLLGALCFSLRRWLARIPRPQLLLGGAVLLFAAGAVLQADRRLLLAATYAIAILGIAASYHPANRFIRVTAPLGQLTYSIYMLHPVVEVIVIGFVAQRLLHFHGVGLNVFILACVAAMIPLGYLSLMLFETPARRYLTALGASRAPSPAVLEAAAVPTDT